MARCIDLETNAASPANLRVRRRFSGVSDGTRTRDIQDHNLTLYQLNYTHHGRKPTFAR